MTGLAIGLYIFIYYPDIVNSLGDISTERVILGCRHDCFISRSVAPADRLAAGDHRGLFLLYALFAYIFPGDFYGRGWSVSRLATYLYLDANGIFGQALQVGASIVVVFVIFGEVLYVVGGAEFFSDFSLALMGRFRGGQAKIAIVSSSSSVTSAAAPWPMSSSTARSRFR